MKSESRFSRRRRVHLARFHVTGIAMALLTGPLGVAGQITLETLLREMTDRDALARWPSPSYTCRQASSYDRDSVGADQPNWFANWDRSHFVRTESRDGRTEYVMMDAAGPGAIVRFWTTWGNFRNGTLRIYLDGENTPVVEEPLGALAGGEALVGPPLAGPHSTDVAKERRAYNIYLPIPYSKHCKVTYESDGIQDAGAHKGEALYYQINYRTYPEGTGVESFSMAGFSRALPLIESTLFAMNRALRGAPGGERVVPLGAHLAPGASVAETMNGPGALRELTLKLEAGDPEQALRSTVLEMAFDGRRTVWVPVGAFFGTGYRPSTFKTWYTEASRDGSLSAYWTMPFKQSCTVRLHNYGSQPVRIKFGRAVIGPWTWGERSMHFGAAWRDYAGEAASGAEENMKGTGAKDMNYVSLEGRGVYAGDTLTVFNGAKKWWGEGDEKIYVDGESFPSHFGTGTEDYYGYAWCRPEPFSNPYNAQPIGEGNLAGGFSVNSRYRLLDGIPFTESLHFDMELWHWAKTRIDYAPATFFYSFPGTRWNVKPMPGQAARPVPRTIEDVLELYREPGAIEGESMTVESVTGGKVEEQFFPEIGWSRGRQVWWKDGKPGDRLRLAFEVKQAGSQNLVGRFTKANDYAVIRIRVNDKVVIDSLDGYHPEVTTERLALGTVPLNEGHNILEIEILGAHPDAIPRHMFGVDYLKLEHSLEIMRKETGCETFTGYCFVCLGHGPLIGTRTDG